MDIQSLVPSNKLDLETAKMAIAAGFPRVEPILPALLEWLQDLNWPVARVLAPFLASIGEPMIPHLERIFSTDDYIWQYWIIECLIARNQVLRRHFTPRLIRLANSPSVTEKLEELDLVAKDALAMNKD